MIIRRSVAADTDFIRKVHLNAFGASEGESVSALAIKLLDDPSAMPLISLVAEENDEIIANVIFTSVTIKGGGPTARAQILSPLAVVPEHQGKGIGGKLIEAGLNILKTQHTDIVLVLGDPQYYSRAGFTANHNIEPPYELDYPEAWMAQELTKGALKRTKGLAQCATALSSPELW